MRLRPVLVCGSVSLLLLLFAAIRWASSEPAPSTPVEEQIRQVATVNPEPVKISSQKIRRRSEDGDLFREVTTETGITFRHVSGDSPDKPFPAANGSGVAAIDIDLDGYQDLYFATGTPIPVKPDSQSPRNRIYRNLGGWRFIDITDNSGLGHDGYSAGVAVGDYDADGFPDVYVACYGPNRLYRNLGDGTFQEVALGAGVADDRWATSAGFLDYDDDGLVDLYVCNYGIWSLATNAYCGDRPSGVRMFCSPTSIEPEPDILFRNTGTGTFDDATTESGIGVRRLRGQGVVAADVNGDGRIDIYVGNDLHANSLFVNAGGGRFRDVSETSGTAYDERGNVRAGMGVDVADINGDGKFEIFVTNFQNEANSLYEIQGGEFFREIGALRGLAADGIPWVGWGTAMVDFDVDGWPDVMVTNGHVDNNRHLVGQNAPYFQPCLIWKSVRGNFRVMGSEAGDYFSIDHVGRGLITVDLDNDGDQDVVIGHQDEAPALLLNQAIRHTGDSRSLVLRLVGTTNNRDATGSLVTFRSGLRSAALQIKGGGSYLSANERRLFFAVLPEDGPFTIEVRWPDGRQDNFADLMPGHEYVIVESVGSAPGTPHIMESH